MVKSLRRPDAFGEDSFLAGKKCVRSQNAPDVSSRFLLSV
jgi:hypothetical protein